MAACGAAAARLPLGWRVAWCHRYSKRPSRKAVIRLLTVTALSLKVFFPGGRKRMSFATAKALVHLSTLLASFRTSFHVELSREASSRRAVFGQWRRRTTRASKISSRLKGSGGEAVKGSAAEEARWAWSGEECVRGCRVAAVGEGGGESKLVTAGKKMSDGSASSAGSSR